MTSAEVSFQQRRDETLASCARLATACLCLLPLVAELHPGVTDDRLPVTVVLKYFVADVLCRRRVYFKEGCIFIPSQVVKNFFVLYKDPV